MLWFWSVFLLLSLATSDYVVHIPGSAKDAIAHLNNEGFEVVRQWNVPEWYHIKCTGSRCASGHHALRSTARHMEELKPLERRTRGDITYKQYHIMCSRFDNPMPFCQNIQPVWKECINGTGVTVAVVDDGVSRHADLVKNLDLDLSYDFNFNDNDPTPASGATHGTACAGLVAAEAGNNVCGSGVAPGAKLVGHRVLGAWPTAAQSADAISRNCEIIDVYSHSYGPRDDNQQLEGPSAAELAAIEYTLEHGRGGKGSIHVWAAGNGGRSSGNTNFDGYSNSRYTISVAAVTSEARRPSWGEIGASNVISAASSGGTLGITTTTYSTSNNKACRDDFGGTSASTPQIAGVVALMLQANPNLGWRDVRDIVVRSGQIVDPHNVEAPWMRNAAGLWYSEAFGFGVIDAKRAVDRARQHQNVGPEKTHSTGTMSVNHIVIQPSSSKKFKWTITDNTVKKITDVELRIHAQFNGTFIDMQSMNLIAPSGQTARLVRPHNTADKHIGWTFTTPMFWDTAPQGEWTLRVANGGSTQPFWVDDIQMNIFGL